MGWDDGPLARTTMETQFADGANSPVESGDRAPLGRMDLLVVCYPARWAGLRNFALLALIVSSGPKRRHPSAQHNGRGSGGNRQHGEAKPYGSRTRTRRRRRHLQSSLLLRGDAPEVA